MIQLLQSKHKATVPALIGPEENSKKKGKGGYSGSEGS